VGVTASAVTTPLAQEIVFLAETGNADIWAGYHVYFFPEHLGAFFYVVGSGGSGIVGGS
jgi:hypothetical protein